MYFTSVPTIFYLTFFKVIIRIRYTSNTLPTQFHSVVNFFYMRPSGKTPTEESNGISIVFFIFYSFYDKITCFVGPFNFNFNNYMLLYFTNYSHLMRDTMRRHTGYAYTIYMGPYGCVRVYAYFYI